MDKIMELANRYGLFVVEDAAQAIDSYYTGKAGIKRALGTIGHLSAFSFHETKNIQCGEGGLLGINDDRFLKRAEIIWEKGTNRAEFFRGEVNKYGWVDIGSSFLPSEVTAAFLWAQMEELDKIQTKRIEIWNSYYVLLSKWGMKHGVQIPLIPDYATNNGHMFYLVCPTGEFRASLIKHLKENAVSSVFHYLSLHKSLYYLYRHDGGELRQADRYSECLVRLPLYFELCEAFVIDYFQRQLI
jgi:dTDP-4-amino-4,6-dideoxygalactose transaminase